MHVCRVCVPFRRGSWSQGASAGNRVRRRLACELACAEPVDGGERGHELASDGGTIQASIRAPAVGAFHVCRPCFTRSQHRMVAGATIVVDAHGTDLRRTL